MKSCLTRLPVMIPRLFPGSALNSTGSLMRDAVLWSACGLWFVSSWCAISCAAELEYNRDIRPILAENCFACHGPDSAARKADLRLDKREAAIEMGAITPGDPAASSLIERIFSTDPDVVMPPPAAHKQLTPAQQQTLKRWIEAGAEYQPHWSFIAPQRPAIPVVSRPEWVRNPIDAFVLAKLDAAGLTPAPEADKRTLARRVSFDLTGLPPETELLNRFLRDDSPEAYEKYVDELLKSPRWGEHRGRYWLDYARYADTHGIHFDNYREMWTYRDWVINAFNANMPYDQFTIENLAGDLVPNRTLEQWIGSGFNRCNMTTNEGGIIDEEYLVLYARDRTETTSQVWLGLTANCAVCHDHKFDPLSQREFYELSAFFNNTTQGARDGNVKDTPPIVPVMLPEDRPRFAELEQLIPARKAELAARRQAARPAFNEWQQSASADVLKESIPVAGLELHAPLNEGDGFSARATVAGAKRDLLLAGSVSWEAGPTGKALKTQGTAFELADFGRFEKDEAFTLAAWVKVAANDGQGAICSRMDNTQAYRGWDFWMQARRVGTHIINAWADNALKVVAKNQVPANKWVHVAVTYDGSAKAAGVKVYYDGVPQETNVEADKLTGTIQTDVPFKVGQRSSSDPFGGSLQDLRIYRRALTPGELLALGQASKFSQILEKPLAARSDAEQNELYSYWLNHFDADFQRLTSEISALEQEQNTLKARGTIAHVMVEKPGEAMAYVLYRGEYDQRRDEVRAGTPEILPPFPAEFPRNRLGFAQWLLLPEHPLTSRVTVNRFWQEVFGTGIVRTVGDFGVSGELPSHPELLDWLAVEFRESGWDVKKLFKLIVLSNTYRQAATQTPEKRERDPENRLFSRGPRFRMDAEMVRDHALAASGLLVEKLGGPSVKPYQPDGVWEAIAMNVSNTRAYQRDEGENLYRRSMYWFWKRMAPPASMDIFNAPNREYCVVRRERTNTPLQALVTLNDVQFVEAARWLAQRTLLAGGPLDETRVQFMAERVLSRPLRAEELQIALGSLRDLRDWYGQNQAAARELVAYGASPADPSLPPAELAAWTMLGNELLNLDESLCK
jgi:hypothetical protein